MAASASHTLFPAETYHIAFIVHDLDEALPKFTKMLGTDFHPPVRHRVESRYEKGDPDPNPVDVRTAFSVNGPPYIEVFEAATDTGVYGRDQGEGFHHIGVFVNGTEDVERYLESEGVTARLRLTIPEGSPMMWHSDPADSHGMSVHYVDASLRSGFLSAISPSDGQAVRSTSDATQDD